MSRAYYYLVASLPSISFQDRPVLTMDQFLARCRQQLAHDDFARLETALRGESSRCDVGQDSFGRWINFNRRYRNEMAYFRAKRAHQDPQNHVRGVREPDPVLAEALNSAAKAPDPLSSEKILDQLRWQFLDELSLGHYFDFDVVLIYALKLQMVERYSRIESGQGKEFFEEYKGIQLRIN